MAHHYKAIVLVPVEVEWKCANKLTDEAAKNLARHKAVANLGHVKPEQTVIQQIVLMEPEDVKPC